MPLTPWTKSKNGWQAVFLFESPQVGHAKVSASKISTTSYSQYKPQKLNTALYDKRASYRNIARLVDGAGKRELL